MFQKIFGSLFGGSEEKRAEVRSPLVSETATEHLAEIKYDPDTQHGLHYTEEAFDEEVARRVQIEVDTRGVEANISWEKDVRQAVYTEWNRCSLDQFLKHEMAMSYKYMGIQTSGFVKADENNPLLEPIHGIDLRTYAAIVVKLSSGVSETQIFKALNLDPVVWGEVNELWTQRMAEDTSFTVVALYGQYFGENPELPELAGLQPEYSEETKANLQRLKEDVYFYHELVGARQAADTYGMDGAQWIQDQFGIGLGEFQAVAMRHMEERNRNYDSQEITNLIAYQSEKEKEYAQRFAQERGGNVADDLTF